MKYFLLLCAVAAYSPLLVNGNIGKINCPSGAPDKAFENLMTVKCALELGDADISKVTSEAEMMALLAEMMAPQWKCIFGVLKAVDANGKVILAKAQEFSTAFPKAAAKVKTIIAKCVNANNGKLKKEAGKHAKSWVPMSKCLFETMVLNPC